LCKLAITDDGVSRVNFANAAEKTFIALAEAYILSDKITDNAYKNAVLDSFMAFRAKSK
jgi:hypothetical protein